jgi:hypothetical protein
VVHVRSVVLAAAIAACHSEERVAHGPQRAADILATGSAPHLPLGAPLRGREVLPLPNGDLIDLHFDRDRKLVRATAVFEPSELGAFARAWGPPRTWHDDWRDHDEELRAWTNPHDRLRAVARVDSDHRAMLTYERYLPIDDLLGHDSSLAIETRRPLLGEPLDLVRREHPGLEEGNIALVIPLPPQAMARPGEATLIDLQATAGVITSFTFTLPYGDDPDAKRDLFERLQRDYGPATRAPSINGLPRFRLGHEYDVEAGDDGRSWVVSVAPPPPHVGPSAAPR